MTEPELDIIITTHNHIELTIRAIDALYRYTSDKPFRLTVVDDSTDETPIYLKRLAREKENVQLIRASGEIRGSHHLYNMGFEKTNLPIIAVMGNSTTVEPNWLDSAYKLITTRPDCGIVGFKILNPHGTIQSTAVMGVFDNGLMAVNGKEEAGHRCTYISQVPAIGGCLFLVKREAILSLKDSKFDDTTYYGFRGWEDLDMCLSVGEKGWEVIYCGYGSAYHVDSPTKKQGHKTNNFYPELDYNKKTFLAKWQDFKVRSYEQQT